jgi:hypothetical protein
MTKPEQTFQIRDALPSGKLGPERTVTLAQYRAEMDAAKARALFAARQMYGDRFIDRLTNR